MVVNLVLITTYMSLFLKPFLDSNVLDIHKHVLLQKVVHAFLYEVISPSK
jgi:hypothetical protein